MALSSQDVATFAASVKKVNPNISDAELAALVQEAGDVNDDPIKSARLAQKIAQPLINTDLKSGYAGSVQSVRNSANPQASAVSQFDPEQVRAAYADQQAMYQRSLPSRTIGGILAGGSGSSDVMTNNRSAWQDIDTQNKLQTLERQKALQEAATGGLSAARNAQDMFKQSGEYSLSQQKGAEELKQSRQKTETGELGLQAQQRLNNPSSPESMLAKQMLIDQFKSAGVAIPKSLDVSKATAQQLMGFMEPKILEAFKTKTGIAQTAADTRKTEAEIPGVAAESQIKTATANTIAPAGNTGSAMPATPAGSVGPLGWNGNPNNPNDTTPMKPSDKIAVWRDQLSKTTNPADRAALENLIRLESVKPGAGLPTTQAAAKPAQTTGPRLQIPAGSNMSISAGGVSIAPSPAVTGAQSAAATEDKTNREQTKVATQYGLDNLSTSLAKRSADAVKSGGASPTGTMQELLSRRIGAGESERMRSDINRYIDGRIAYSTASGIPVADRETEVQRIMQMSPTAFQNEMVSFNSQVQRLGAYSTAFSKHINETGSAANFDDSQINKKVYLYNPETGKSGLADPDRVPALKKKGYKEINELNR